MIEIFAIILCALLLPAGFFIWLVDREICWQGVHEVELARERIEFRQPGIEPVEDAGVISGVTRYRTLGRYIGKWMGRTWVIAAGYDFDGASVPRALWSVTGYTPVGLHLGAALVHDWLCERRPMWCSSVDAADCFRHYLRLARVRPAKIVAMYWAVRWFGPKWKRKEQRA